MTVKCNKIHTSSDERLKSDIQDLRYNGPLSPKQFELYGQQEIGFIAQDIIKQYPQLVSTDDDGYYSVNYDGITAILSYENNQLRKEVDELRQ